MGVFDSLTGLIGNYFTNYWVKRKNISKEDLATCMGVAHNDESTKTCEICVALNNTIFRNDNKPTYSHINCKCVYSPTVLSNVVLDFKTEKITEYLFINENKKKMMLSMGYDINSSTEIYDLVSNTIKNNFMTGNYNLQILNENGQHVTIKFILNGKGAYIDKIFKCHTGCVVWPNGKIKIATPVVKD